MNKIYCYLGLMSFFFLKVFSHQHDLLWRLKNITLILRENINEVEYKYEKKRSPPVGAERHALPNLSSEM